VNLRIQPEVPAHCQHFAAIRGKRRCIDFERYDFTVWRLIARELRRRA
jgi:hypothetical protein